METVSMRREGVCSGQRSPPASGFNAGSSEKSRPLWADVNATLMLWSRATGFGRESAWARDNDFGGPGLLAEEEYLWQGQMGGCK